MPSLHQTNIKFPIEIWDKLLEMKAKKGQSIKDILINSLHQSEMIDRELLVLDHSNYVSKNKDLKMILLDFEITLLECGESNTDLDLNQALVFLDRLKRCVI